MNPSFQFLLLCVSSIIIAGLSISNDVVLISARELSLRPAGRNLLSSAPKQEVELIAAPNGTVFLMDSDSGKVLWSFPSGPSIYSSYHTPIHQEDEKDKDVAHKRYSFVDCGDDWGLYLNNHYEKRKLEGTIQDYVKKTPMYEDDEVTVGSMHSTVYKVDLWTGRLIYGYGKSVTVNVSQGGKETSSEENTKELKNSGSPSAKGSNVELYIERIDYTLSTKTFDKLLWNLTVGVFKAKLRCKGSNLDRKLGPESDPNRIVLLPCGFEFPVHRFRRQSMFESFVGLDGVRDPLSKHNMLPTDASHKDDKVSNTHHKGVPLPIDNHLHRASREVLERHIGTHTRRAQSLSMLVRGYVPWFFGLLVLVVIGFALHYKSNSNAQPVSSKRKKSRKSGKNILALEEGQDNESTIRRWPNLNSLIQGDTNGRTIGRLFVSNQEIAKGSNGTVVYEGIYDGRKVAVKRLVQAHHDVAFKEIQNLIASDQHPNIVRWHGVEYDHDFVYLSLELCSCSLHDLIESYAESTQNSVLFDDKSLSAMTDYKVRLNSVKADLQEIKLWKSNGYPSALLLKLMRDVVSGLVHLHELGIIHRDIKPQNVLISKENTLCAKLSDMGISKRLLADMSSLGHLATGHGSSGWQAPEQLLYGRQTRAMDIFSLGSVLFFCVTGGRHPFGDRFERDANIIKNQIDLFMVENIPEALELFSRLLQPDPEIRPNALEVLHHPFFWNSEMRLSFLHDASDRVELEDRATNSVILNALESTAPTAIGTKWDEKMELAFINNIGRYRRYKYESVRDLLRVIRNKLNHYRELPPEIQGLLGPLPDGFDDYFVTRFPRLLIEVYKVVNKYCRAEKWFQKYLQGSVL